MKCENCNDAKAATTQRSVEAAGPRTYRVNLCKECHQTYKTSYSGISSLPGLLSKWATTPLDE